MRQAFIAQHPTEAHFLKGLLEAEGIAAEVRGETLFGARGEAPVTSETLPSVWLVNDQQLETAIALVARYASRHGPPEQISAPWPCPNCGEQCESQFTECWKCGATRPSNQ